MLKGLGDLGQIMKLQREMKNMQHKIAKATIEGADAGGRVKATVNGEYRLVRIDIDNALLGEGREKAEKAVLQAVNDAVERMKAYSTEELGKLKDALQIPGMDQFFK
ncbi:MAG: YbaB/EbfC family nucleoid-associated protein [Spirochaetes bacterium]|nr:YbaB/EbfC family nucleoid-associated protein [Spirochaetota bacterium]